MLHHLKSKKILNWCFFDFGISSYPTLILTFFYGAYYSKYIAHNPTVGTSSWGFAISLASVFSFLIFAFLLVVGKSYFKFISVNFFKVSFYIMGLSSATLIFFDKGSSQILPLIVIIISFISFEIVNFFYNFCLHKVSSRNSQGSVSNLGWGFGYLGGLISILLVFIWIKFSEGLDLFGVSPLLLVGPFICFWSLIFGRKHFKNFQNERFNIPKITNFFSDVKSKKLTNFLFGYFFFNNAVICIFAFASMFASFLFGLTESEILFLGIFINLFGIFGCYVLGRIDDKFGSLKNVKLCVCFLLICSLLLFFIKSILLFWLLALTIGFFIGPIQASSRSVITKEIDSSNQLSAFALFSIFGNICAILGPFLVGLVIDLTSSIRLGLLVIPIFLLMAIIILTSKLHIK